MQDIDSTSTIRKEEMEMKFRQWTDAIMAPSSSPPLMMMSPTPATPTALQIEAQQYFHTIIRSTSSLSSTNSSNNSNHRDANYEAAIAALLQTLQPCFVSTPTTRNIYLALSCLVGALQASNSCCQDGPSSPRIRPNLTTTTTVSSPEVLLSMSFVQVVSTFLITYAGPITLPTERHDHTTATSSRDTTIHHHSHTDNYYYDIEQIRDLAMDGLMAVVTIGGTSRATIHEWVPLLYSVARQGVEHRCAMVEDPSLIRETHDEMTDDDNDNTDLYGFPQPRTPPSTIRPTTRTIEHGLALLPRSRRTLCFTLLQQTVYSIVRCLDHPSTSSSSGTSTSSKLLTTTPTTTTSTQSTILQLIQLTTSCLRGESDPRCLLQLLQLFATMLIQFFPLFSSPDSANTDDTIDFAMQIVHYFFDAVVPYYPIQFQPPPDNNIYGITRLSLRQAVMCILSCTLYDTPLSNISTTGINRMDDYTDSYRRHDDDDDGATTMSSLACQLLLDCLIPSPNDEPLTYKEQSEILEDFEQFLFTTNATNLGKDNIAMLTNLEKLHVAHQTAIADALIVIHEKSSLAVSQKKNSSGKSNTNDAKQLADLCRSIITKIAIATERIPFQNDNNIYVHPWYTMVEVPVRKLSQHLFDRANLRIAIAYMACVTASGGYKTLNLCLECGLTPLFQYNKATTNRNVTYNKNDETFMATIYGIGAFFASCRFALNAALRDGIHWYPHPLVPYCNEALHLILGYLILDDNANDDDVKDSTQQIQVASIRALESILMASPKTAFGPNQIDELVTGVSTLSNNISLTGEGLQRAYSETFGTLLGQVLDAQALLALSEVETTNNQILIHSVQLRQYFLESLLPRLLTSVQGVSPQQHDRQLLAKAAAYSLNAASYIIQTLTKALHIALVTESDYVPAKSIVESMAFLFEQENQFVAQAYQELSSPQVTADDILSALVPTTSEQRGNMEALFGISALQLPTSVEDRIKNGVELEKVYSIILPLRKGYEHELSTTRLLTLVDSVSKVLPPLSDMDTLKLSAILPLLAAALENGRSLSIDSSESTKLQELISHMIEDFADFTMGPENHNVARVSAARCLHAAIVRFLPHMTLECTVRVLTTNKLLPSLRLGMSTIRDKSIQSHQREATISICIDTLNVLAMLCSAAAIRGGISSKSSDKIILFLVDLACKKKSIGIFTELGDEMVDVSAFDSSPNQNESSRIAIMVAALIGSILTTEGRGSGLWRQRLIHIVMKRILEADTYISGTTGSQSEVHDSVGTVTTICHVLCSANIPAVLSADKCVVVGTILSQSLTSTEMLVDGAVTFKLILATILKMICTAPSCFRSVYPLVTGSLRVYATVDESPDGIVCKILALQVLSAVAQMGESDFTFLEAVERIRPAVLSLLGIAVDHPLSALRSAAVEVRNNWHVVP